MALFSRAYNAVKHLVIPFNACFIGNIRSARCVKANRKSTFCPLRRESEVIKHGGVEIIFFSAFIPAVKNIAVFFALCWHFRLLTAQDFLRANGTAAVCVKRRCALCAVFYIGCSENCAVENTACDFAVVCNSAVFVKYAVFNFAAADEESLKNNVGHINIGADHHRVFSFNCNIFAA